MTLRTAVVGAGMVSEQHTSALAACPLTELVAICDLDIDRAREAAREYRVDVYDDVEELLETADLDWIHLCTPVQTHLELARLAIEAGVPVQIEKPLTETVAEAEELAELAETHGVRVTSVEQHRFDPAVRKAMARIRDGDLGRIRGVDVIYSGLTKPDEVHRGAWAFDLAGGEFEEGLPHPLYLMLAVGGQPASEDAVCATTSLLDEYERPFTYDGAQIQYATDEGVLCSAKFVAGTAPQRLVVVHGEDRSVTVDLVSQTLVGVGLNYNGSMVAKVRNNLGRAASRVVGTVSSAVLAVQTRGDDWEQRVRIDPHAAQIDAEARALLNGRAAPVPLEDSVWTIRLMEHIREAGSTTATPADAVL